MNQSFWRKWHRWIAFVAAPFLLYAAITGVCLACYEFFGEEEELRRSWRRSPVTLPASESAWSGVIAKAISTAAAQSPGAPVDKVSIEFKGDRPMVVVYIGKPGGGEDRKFIVDAKTGELLRTEAYVDKPFLVRLHSGEAWGDGALVVAMCWGASLVVILLTGVIIYFKMHVNTGCSPTEPWTPTSKELRPQRVTATSSSSRSPRRAAECRSTVARFTMKSNSSSSNEAPRTSRIHESMASST